MIEIRHVQLQHVYFVTWHLFAASIQGLPTYYRNIYNRSGPATSGTAGVVRYATLTSRMMNVPARLHYHTLGIRCRDHPLFTSNLNLVLSLFLLDFFREPFLHEATSSVSVQSPFSHTHFRTAKSSESRGQQMDLNVEV